VRQQFRRGLAASAAVALLLAACGNGDDEPQDEAATETSEEGQQEALDDLTADAEDMEDPNEDIEDGVYAGNGVLLPVPDGWQLDPQAFQQGIVAAVSDDQQSQMTAGAVEVGDEEVDFDELLDSVRQQFGDDVDVDEEVELEGAERAHRLSIAGLPPQQEGMPESDVTFLLAEDGNGLVGEFAFAAPSEAYDDELVDLLLAEAGFDADSEPPEMPQMQQQPAPEGEEMPEEMQEELEELERQMQQEQEEQ
jgi:hypothetical protein